MILKFYEQVQAKNVPSALFLGVTGRKNGLYQTTVQYAQRGEQMFVVQYGEN